MTSNPQISIQDIRQEFEMLLDFVTGAQAQQATANQVERGLFKLLLAIGVKLLTLFFVMRSEACSRDTIQTATGAILPYERDTKRTYYSIFAVKAGNFSEDRTPRSYSKFFALPGARPECPYLP